MYLLHTSVHISHSGCSSKTRQAKMSQILQVKCYPSECIILHYHFWCSLLRNIHVNPLLTNLSCRVKMAGKWLRSLFVCVYEPQLCLHP